MTEHYVYPEQRHKRLRSRARAQTSGVREHYEAGINAYQGGDLNQAERESRAALRLEPGFLEAHYNLGLVLLQK